MEIPNDEVPKRLLEIESILREHCRDWLLCVRFEGQTYWFRSSDYAAWGLGHLCLKAIEKTFTGEVQEVEREQES